MANLYGAQFQGADLYEAQFQPTGSHSTDGVFGQAQFQGVCCGQFPKLTFQEQIRNRIGQESDLSKVVFSGGLTQEKVDDIVISPVSVA